MDTILEKILPSLKESNEVLSEIAKVCAFLALASVLIGSVLIFQYSEFYNIRYPFDLASSSTFAPFLCLIFMLISFVYTLMFFFLSYGRFFPKVKNDDIYALHDEVFSLFYFDKDKNVIYDRFHHITTIQIFVVIPGVTLVWTFRYLNELSVLQSGVLLFCTLLFWACMPRLSRIIAKTKINKQGGHLYRPKINLPIRLEYIWYSLGFTVYQLIPLCLYFGFVDECDYMDTVFNKVIACLVYAIIMTSILVYEEPKERKKLRPSQLMQRSESMNGKPELKRFFTKYQKRAFLTCIIGIVVFPNMATRFTESSLRILGIGGFYVEYAIPPKYKDHIDTRFIAQKKKSNMLVTKKAFLILESQTHVTLLLWHESNTELKKGVKTEIKKEHLIKSEILQKKSPHSYNQEIIESNKKDGKQEKPPSG